MGSRNQISSTAIIGTDVKIGNNVSIGANCIIGNHVVIGDETIIKERCIISDNVSLGSGCKIDYDVIIRENVVVGDSTFVGNRCILGELLADQIIEMRQEKVLQIGINSIIRSNSILYGGSVIGNDFQTGHHVTIREDAQIGHHVSVGTLSDIQGKCNIGNYVRMHSNVHIGQLSRIDDYVWIFPYVVLTNDPTPPSENLLGVHVNSFAIIATGSVIMPGIEVGRESLIGAGAIVTRNVEDYAAVVGNPAKKISDVRNIKNKVTGEKAYPWRCYFKRGMPWENSSFQEWFESLSEEEKNRIIPDIDKIY